MTTNPVALIILDGWGVSEPSIGNAISIAKPKYWDYLLRNYPSFLLQASGEASGLPYGEVGNSEVGHLTIGSGQIILQSLNRINKEILNGNFFKNDVLLKAINHVREKNSALHLIGLLGTGGVHAHQAHLESLIKLACENKLERVYLHLFLDGRDTPKDRGVTYMKSLLRTIEVYNCGKIATISGRFYGMDRNNNWDRIKSSYDAIVHSVSGDRGEDPVVAIQLSYAKNIFDEEFQPFVVTANDEPVAKITDGDAVVFFNFRADRARQMLNAFIQEDFQEFDRGEKLKDLYVVTFTEYQKKLPVDVAFRRPEIINTLAQTISEAGLSQLHIAETEKYAHVTFFLNGLKEESYEKEERILIPSPDVLTYDEKPEMSAHLIKNELLKNINNDKFDFYVANFANADMVGHTGNLDASVMAISELDNVLSEIVPALLSKNATIIITADHGNVEEVVNLKTGEIDKEHSSYPVPCIIVNEKFKNAGRGVTSDELYQKDINGVLSDIAPTVLGFLNIKTPKQMMGIDLSKKIITKIF